MTEPRKGRAVNARKRSPKEAKQKERSRRRRGKLPLFRVALLPSTRAPSPHNAAFSHAFFPADRARALEWNTRARRSSAAPNCFLMAEKEDALVSRGLFQKATSGVGFRTRAGERGLKGRATPPKPRHAAEGTPPRDTHTADPPDEDGTLKQSTAEAAAAACTLAGPGGENQR
ncbi:hypothetical protein MRX96_028123 [Rhipicephalus microplus]